ncbi:hypothetical protein BJX96DRAFT_145890 [Aspergillus floccosus]
MCRLTRESIQGATTNATSSNRCMHFTLSIQYDTEEGKVVHLNDQPAQRGPLCRTKIPQQRLSVGVAVYAQVRRIEDAGAKGPRTRAECEVGAAATGNVHRAVVEEREVPDVQADIGWDEAQGGVHWKTHSVDHWRTEGLNTTHPKKPSQLLNPVSSHPKLQLGNFLPRPFHRR